MLEKPFTAWQSFKLFVISLTEGLFYLIGTPLFELNILELIGMVCPLRFDSTHRNILILNFF